MTKKKCQKPETEVNDIVNMIYDTIYGAGINQLDVKKLFVNGYRIMLKENMKVVFLHEELIDRYFDNDLTTDNFRAFQAIGKILEKLR